jgi:hypothetical protein
VIILNLKRLQLAEETFLNEFPGGFNNEQMVAIRKKHKVEKMIELVQDVFSIDKFDDIDMIVQNMSLVVGRASVVSVFEKVKFKEYINNISAKDKEKLSNSLKELLYGNEEKGFTEMVEVLSIQKLAKWPLLTVWGVYFRPNEEIFVKPTATKNIIKFLEIEEVIYKPTPTYEFYNKYRKIVNDIKNEVDSSFSTYNVAFTGFLMMGIDLLR